MKKRSALALLLAASTAACAYLPPAIPLDGSADQRAALVGEWSGTYAYEQHQWRSGSIAFVLREAGDTARGDVLMMVPSEPDPSASGAVSQWVQVQPANPMGQILTIAFVRAGAGTVVGELDPYVDPACRCVLVARFQGRVEGDSISGSFTARRSDTGEARSGRWKATRHRKR